MNERAIRLMCAERVRPFGETIFAEMSRLALEHDAINLGQGFPNFDGPDFVKDAAKRALDEGRNQYARSIGEPALNEALARHLSAHADWQIDPREHVTITSGCTEALAASFLGLVDPDDEVILFEPYYDSYRACAAFAGATPRFVTLRPPDFSFDADELRRAFTPKTRAILVNTPHNPTGKVFSRAELEQIASLCHEFDALAFTDEVYEHLVYDGGSHTRLAMLEDMWDRTVTMSSLGKTFSLTGWKIGWSIAPAHLTDGVRRAHQFLTFASATPLEHAAAVALDAPSSYFEGLREVFATRRDMLVDGLRSAGFTPYVPDGGYFVLADHTSFGFEDDVAFCRHLIERAGVVAIPPSAFYEHKEAGRSLVRFAFCKDEETLDRATDRLQTLAHGS